MNEDPTGSEVELRMSYRYVQQHPWVVPAVTGFLSAYFMEKPGFRVQRQFVDLETGMQVWLCDVPAGMKMPILLKRLQEDIPPYRYREIATEPHARSQYIIDSADPGS